MANGGAPRMKPCHISTLVLVGWYLIFPAVELDRATGDTTAPLSAWYKAKPPYDSKDDCKRAKTGWSQFTAGVLKLHLSKLRPL